LLHRDRRGKPAEKQFAFLIVAPQRNNSSSTKKFELPSLSSTRFSSFIPRLLRPNAYVLGFARRRRIAAPGDGHANIDGTV
jgi:hypothetical protein